MMNLLSLALLLTQNLAGLSGIIVNPDGIPIDNVHVYTMCHDAETYSDKNGAYTLMNQKDSDSITLCFSAIGYKQAEWTGKTGQIPRIVLQEDAISIDEVIIKSDRYGRINNYAAQRIDINPFEVYTSPTAFGDILGALKIIPGTQSPENDGRLYVRGGTSDEAKTYVDGMLVYNPYTLSQKNVPVRSRFTPNMYQGVALQSGGYASEFGQALSGFLSLTTKDQLEKKINLNLSTTGLEGSMVHATKHSQVFAGLSYTNMEPYGRIFRDAYDWNKYYEDISGNTLGIFRISDNLKIKTQLSFSRSSVGYMHPDIDSLLFRNDFSTSYVFGQATGTYFFNKSTKLIFGSNLTADKFHGTDVRFQGDRVQTEVLFNHNKILLEHKKDKFTYSVGFEALHSIFDQKYDYQGPYDSNLNHWLVSPFSQVAFSPDEVTCISFGLRTEHSFLTGRYNLAPRLYASRKFMDFHILSFSAGSYFQSPDYDYLKLNKHLDFTRSENVTLTYAYAKNKSKFQADTYYKRYTNLITYEEGAFYPLNLGNHGYGYAYGTDIFLKGYQGMLEYWISYSYLNSQRIYQAYTRTRMPDLLSRHLLKFDLKYWISPVRSLLGAGYHIDSGSYSNVPVDGKKTWMKTPFRNSLTLNLSYLPFDHTVIHFSCQNVLGKKNIYGYTSSLTQGKYQAETTPSRRFYYIALLLTFNASKINDSLRSL